MLSVFTDGMPSGDFTLFNEKMNVCQIPCFIYLNKKVPRGLGSLIPFSLVSVGGGSRGSLSVKKSQSLVTAVTGN